MSGRKKTRLSVHGITCWIDVKDSCLFTLGIGAVAFFAEESCDEKAICGSVGWKNMFLEYSMEDNCGCRGNVQLGIVVLR